jgi:Ni,Fe-hydrogenase III small subunit/ferredoxin
MINVLKARLQQKFRTMPFPSEKTKPLDRFKGYPECSREKCDQCMSCVRCCPVNAISVQAETIEVDLGKCLFCGDCMSICTKGCISFTGDYRLAARSREQLVAGRNERVLAAALDTKMKKLFGRSLKLRQVSAAGCNACEADTNVLSTIGFDLGRFGIQFVASPRHADGILVTGPVSNNMRLALEKTYEAIPDPKLVIAVGACAISGGIFADHDEVNNGAEGILNVDLFIPGCPPHPLTILDGLLRLLGKLDS